jgi:hypothetical protein
MKMGIIIPILVHSWHRESRKWGLGVHVALQVLWQVVGQVVGQEVYSDTDAGFPAGLVMIVYVDSCYLQIM